MNRGSDEGAGTVPVVREEMAQRTAPATLFIMILALAAGTFAVYSPVGSHEFINYDDPDYILDNPHINSGLSWSGIVWAFTHGYAANWHPLTWISHMVDCQLFGWNPGAHHLVNVFFHIANTVLLFILLNYMTRARWRSFVVAALFAWHPLHVESVAWASERKDVLSALFWMLTLLCYARWKTGDGRWEMEDGRAERSPRSSALFYSLALFFFACGLMSKPMVVTLPCVLLLLDFWPLQRFSASTLQRLILEKIPFFALAAASSVVTMAVQKHALWSSGSLPFQFRLANALMSYVRYISKIFLPTDLALIYPYPHYWPLVGVVATAAVLFALTVIFVVQAKRFPYLAVGWLWFLGTLVPAIGLVQAGVQSMADRYTYLPSIGIFILVTWGISDLVASSPRKVGTCAVTGSCALIACLVLTSIQLRYWQNSLSIFTHTVNVTVDNYAADDCLGKTLQNKGDNIDAEKFFEQAVSLEPTYPMAQFDLGMNLLRLGDSNDGGQHLAAAVQLYPNDPVMQYDYGVFLLKHGRAQEAADHLKAALALNPDLTQARQQLDRLKR